MQKLSITTPPTKNQGMAINAKKLMYKANEQINYDYFEIRLKTEIKKLQVIELKGFYKLYGDGNKTFDGIKKF